MNLKEIVGKLGKVAADGVFTAASYLSDNLMGAYRATEDLRLDLSKKDDLEKYQKFSERDLTTTTYEMAEFHRERDQRGTLNLISKYVDKNLEGVLSESEELTASLALRNCPDKDISTDKPYNETRKSISENQSESEQMERNPMGYFKAAFSAASDLAKYFMAGHEREYIQIKQRQIQRNISLALGGHGAKKFLIETYQAFAKQAKSLSDTITPIKEAIDAKVEAEEISKRRELYVVERQQLVANDTKKIEEEREKFPYAPSRDKLLQDITGTTINFLEQKEAMEKAQREAAAQAQTRVA